MNGNQIYTYILFRIQCNGLESTFSLTASDQYDLKHKNNNDLAT